LIVTVEAVVKMSEEVPVTKTLPLKSVPMAITESAIIDPLS